jgi:hypothetical protein
VDGGAIDVSPDWEEIAGVVDEAYRCVAPVSLVRLLDAGEPPTV